LSNIAACKRDILLYKPDALILVDYPGFNLRIAEFAKQQGIRVFYYISPQVWAWKSSRVKAIKRDVDRMLTILPFETDFYKKFGYDVSFVGHPLLDAISRNKPVPVKESADKAPVIALLPGSRKQEISVMLPLMLSVVQKFPGYRFVIAAAPSIDAAFYKQFVKDDNVEVIAGNTYGLLASSRAALVTSGTATLETALFKVPEVVCYKGNVISYHIARKLIKVKYISLVNLIMDREVVRELIQDELNPDMIEKELKKLLEDGPYRQTMLNDFDALQNMLGGIGASDRAAAIITSDLGV
jgi:lipid-A-disaccharide synthase